VTTVPREGSQTAPQFDDDPVPIEIRKVAEM
jgi:hypothetical protein